MKIWIKLLAGAAAGLLLGHLLPLQQGTLHYVSTLVQNIGRYGIYPLLCFSLPLAVLELKKEKKILTVYGRAIGYMLGASLLLVLVGTASVLLLSPNRIPIIVERDIPVSLPGIRETLLSMFPKNPFVLSLDDGNFLLPLYTFCFILGMNFSFDRIITRPAVQLFDSLSRVFYHLNTFLVEITGIGIIAVAAWWWFSITNIADYEIYSQTVLMLAINAGIVIFAIVPLAVHFLCQRENPFKRLYALITPIIVAFFSGNLFFALPGLIHHGKENLGIPRKSGISLFPLFIMFGKAGSAMVASAVFLVIIRSYSSLGITVSTVFWVILFSFLAAMVSSPLPGTGVYAALLFLCRHYGQGLEEGYLIVMPVMPLLQSIAAALDISCAGITAYLASRHEGLTKEIKISDYA